MKKKHENRDFFVLDLNEVVPKDDLVSMEHPLFSLATKPDMRILEYANNGHKLRVLPSIYGLATIFDKDVLIWAISKIIHAKNNGEFYGRKINGSARELLCSTNRGTGGTEYKALKKSFVRLRQTTFESDIPTGGKVESRIFGLVEEAAFVYDADNNRLDEVEIILSEWLFRAVDAFEVVTISPDYFRLRRPLERRIYEIARKHCGHKSKWQIGLDMLQLKTGSNAPLKRFRHNIKEIITENHTPFYKIELTDKDQVIFRPRVTAKKISAQVQIPSWAEEKCRVIAHEKGWDYYALEREWIALASSGTPPDNAGAAFVGFCRKKKALR